jgi:succinate dehydrogenase / fumarate reductase cytochrome b subunit
MITNRPLSPHLSIHKKILTSVFSIFHRITGIGLSVGSVLIAIWVSLIALGPKFFFIFELLASSLIFKSILFLWTLGIFYHLFNGTRYLLWTYGLGMDLKTVYNSGYLILFLTLVATFFIWLI